jgi:hypothetical protein
MLAHGNDQTAAEDWRSGRLLNLTEFVTLSGGEEDVARARS